MWLEVADGDGGVFCSTSPTKQPNQLTLRQVSGIGGRSGTYVGSRNRIPFCRTSLWVLGARCSRVSYYIPESVIQFPPVAQSSRFRRIIRRKSLNTKKKKKAPRTTKTTTCNHADDSIPFFSSPTHYGSVSAPRAPRTQYGIACPQSQEEKEERKLSTQRVSSCVEHPFLY